MRLVDAGVVHSLPLVQESALPAKCGGVGPRSAGGGDVRREDHAERFAYHSGVVHKPGTGRAFQPDSGDTGECKSELYDHAAGVAAVSGGQ